MHNNRSLTSEHRRHDRLLVTRFAMDDAYPSERDEAKALLESCADCASLAADIRLVSTAVSRLPQPSRPRDFSITAEQAEQLKGSRLARWLRSLGTPGWAALRPVAGVAMSIGLVMAVAGATLPRVETVVTHEAPGAHAPASTAQPPLAADPDPTRPTELEPDRVGGSVNAPGQETIDLMANASPDPVTLEYDGAYLRASAAPDAGDDRLSGPVVTVDPTPSLLMTIGLAVAAFSFALLGLAVIARRYFADPLLR